MIDGIKLYKKDVSFANNLRENSLFEFTGNYNESTGEKGNKSTVGYQGLNIVLYDSGVVLIKGSLHKFMNNGIHNYNDFYLSDINFVIEQFAEVFGKEILTAKIENMEFGLNIEPPIKANNVLSNILYHKRNEFKTGTFRNSNYKEAEHQRYYVKVYDKAKQYDRLKEILRVECKYVKMVDLNMIGIYNLADLKKPEIYPELLTILTNNWKQVLFVDETIKISQLSVKWQKKLYDFQNPLYWKKLADNKKQSYLFNKELARYRELIKKHSDNIQEQIKELIIQKWQNLTDISTSEKIESAKINPLYIGLNIAKTPKRCLVTGLDISMQKDSSMFLFITGVQYYFENYKDIYLAVLYPRLSEGWKNQPLKVQFKEIAHSIRNEHNNPKHNTQKRIKRIKKQPTLYPIEEIIDPKTFKIAGYL